ncbi:phosphate/phosphite/phosphonate ABC transporter substrate-binding protein [Roseospira visakhapatnamensis]|uniref:Phosphonate transport system substrate-binding protein n=1 Tax=Roseospira visakhapatnamensis TaxID=390880 RepID=A0A7W6RDD5_9PROT|nr:phosphate/phosphite/phosphonate ABC transporter substrate-binding protein [Roseospira visakhapatnamensis]MBB4266455.1 phosphonate transport system substrate-binding protein [Roseospira visakhapatnamensis]
MSQTRIATRHGAARRALVSGLVSGLVSAMLLMGLAPAMAADEGEPPAPLSLGFMPYLNAEHLIEKYTPLARYLSEALGRPVRVTVASNYAEHIRLTGEDQLDISFLGGSPYVVIGDTYGRKPLLARYEFDGQATFRSVILVAADSPVEDLADLSGKRVAFGNINSTLSTQVPVFMLMRAGVRLEDLADYKHLRNHENVVLGVAFGDFDAGAVAEEVFRESGDAAVRVLAYSPALSTHVFVTRATLAPELRAAITEAMTALRDHPDGPAVLGAISDRLTGFVPATDTDYDLHREILSEVLPVLDP